MPFGPGRPGGGTTAIEPFVKAIRSLAKLSEQQCVIGKTKVFLKTDASAALETAREDALRGVVIQQLKDASKALDIKLLDDAGRPLPCRATQLLATKLLNDSGRPCGGWLHVIRRVMAVRAYAMAKSAAD